MLLLIEWVELGVTVMLGVSVTIGEGEGSNESKWNPGKLSSSSSSLSLMSRLEPLRLMPVLEVEERVCRLLVVLVLVVVVVVVVVGVGVGVTVSIGTGVEGPELMGLTLSSRSFFC